MRCGKNCSARSCSDGRGQERACRERGCREHPRSFALDMRGGRALQRTIRPCARDRTVGRTASASGGSCPGRPCRPEAYWELATRVMENDPVNAALWLPLNCRRTNVRTGAKNVKLPETDSGALATALCAVAV